jgi:hypothetical protein
MLLSLATFFFCIICYCCCIGNVTSFGTIENDMNCFEHVITKESTAASRAGDVWRVCLKESPHGDSDSGIVDAIAVRIPESSANQLNEYKEVSLAQSQLSPHILQTVNTSSSSIVIYVDETVDTVANSSACVPSSAGTSSGMCTVRSALDLCKRSLVTVDSNCTIVLPSEQSIVLDVSLGELSMIDAVGTLRIEGQGCTLTSNDSLVIGNNIRFMNITVNSVTVSTSAAVISTTSQFEFHLSNVTLDGFGQPSRRGGTLYLENLAGGSISDVVISNSLGSYGAAICLDISQRVHITGSHFFNNTAAGKFTKHSMPLLGI